MKSRGELATLFEAHAVAGQAIIDTLEQQRANKLVLRLQRESDAFSQVTVWAEALAAALPRHRRDDTLIVGIARKLRDAATDVLRPAPVGLDRVDIHG